MGDIIENIKRAYHAFSTGFDSPDIVAYHGTSLPALRRIMETSRHIGPRTLNYRAEEVFVYPIKDRAVLPFNVELLADEEAQEEASWFAERNAMEHFLAERLGLDPFQAADGIFRTWNVVNGDIDNLRKVIRFARKKYTRAEASRLYDESKKRKGIIIGYSQQIFDSGEPRQLAEEPEIAAVAVINIDIGSLVGIEPLDQESYDYLSSLEEKI